MLGSPNGPAGASQRGLWPIAPAPAPPTAGFTTDGFGRYGIYSLFPGGPNISGALYSHASTIGRFASGIPPSPGIPYHAAHKESLYTSAGYTFGPATPPPGSPYAPVAASRLEFLTKGYNSNIIIQPDFSTSPKKYQENRCEDRCYQIKCEKSCSCHASSDRKFEEISSGCSRTNPIEWSPNNVKKEHLVNPCQVSEITTSVSPVVKIEVTSPTQKVPELSITTMPSISTTNGNIPIGIAVARQRVQHNEILSSPSLPPAGLLTTVNATTHIKDYSRYSDHDSTTGMAANTTGGIPGGGALLQCTEDRTSGLAGWSVGGSHSSIATPTLWQYPAALPVEPMVPLPVPPVGVQLVRDPTTGHLLLLPTTGIEHVQHAVVWPSYQQPPSVLLPPLPPPPLQLLTSTSSDYLSASATLQQHTQTQSTRLLAVTTTDSKRKMPLSIPTATLVKIEADTSMDQSNTLQTVGTIGANSMLSDQNMRPLLTTHVIYQHPTSLILPSAPPEISSSSQAASPVTYLTSQPESSTIIEEELPCVQDASNQTDTPICSEDDTTMNNIVEVIAEAKPTYNRNNQEIESTYYVPDPSKVINTDSECSSSIDTFFTQDNPKSEDPVNIPKPDLSGLELLSNSIVAYASGCNTLKYEENGCNISKQKNIVFGMSRISETDTKSKVDDKLGGLDLLCALAEQRIKEEGDAKFLTLNSTRPNESSESKKEKRKAQKPSPSPIFSKKIKISDECRKEQEITEKTNNTEQCSCKSLDHRTYKSRESEEEVRKYLASMSLSLRETDEWSTMNSTELNMRIKLATLQKKYKETQQELHKLKPKRKSSDEKDAKRKSLKKIPSDRIVTPPPLLDKTDTATLPIKNTEILKPSTLSPPVNKEVQSVTNLAIPKHVREYSHSPDSGRQSSPSADLSDSILDKTTQPAKKRKVGRPKKLQNNSGLHIATETIVAKKPKSGFVGYLLAAKEKLQKENAMVGSDSPPRYIDNTAKKSKSRKNTNNNNNNNIVPNITHNKKHQIEFSKMRPKLKAELTIKAYVEEDDEQVTEETTEKQVDKDLELVAVTVPESPVELQKPVQESVKDPCILTEENLERNGLRVITAMGGLFYAGCLNAVRPPDVYSITLDGERGNRPHILSREEVLKDTVVEVSLNSTKDLVAGARVCTYWSDKNRCLYPGTISDPVTPDPSEDDKHVDIEYDDGDSGRRSIEEIRLLPHDYPIIEYDPNPLLSLCKRRRRTSASTASRSMSLEERRLSQFVASPPPLATMPETEAEKSAATEKEDSRSGTHDSEEDEHQKRKRLKKKKRERHNEKRKKHKHRLCDSSCKHKKHHKKHKKRKKHHNKSSTSSTEEKIESEDLVEDESKEVVEEVFNEEEEVVEELSDEPMDEAEVQSETLVDESEHTEQVNDEESEVAAIEEEEQGTEEEYTGSDNTSDDQRAASQESSETKSKMTPFLPARQLWAWNEEGYRRGSKARSRKRFHKSIKRGKEIITVGNSAVFLSTGRSDRPYVGRIESMWEVCGSKMVRIKWFYHPEEAIGCGELKYPGALFESPHMDDNEVQSISHKCEVLPLKEFKERLGDDPNRYSAVYENNDLYYLAGYYDPGIQSIHLGKSIPCIKSD